MRKLLAVVAAMTMVLGMSGLTAFAAEKDITINGAIKGATYTAYKVFDATYNADSKSTSYTIPDKSTIASEEGFSDIFTTTSNGGKTYVTQKEGVNDATVIQWLKNHDSVIATKANEKDTVTNSEGKSSVTLKPTDYGYYYIKATIGKSADSDYRAAVTIDSNTPVATVNSKITDNPNVPTDGKKVDGKTVNTMAVGEKKTFTLTFNATNYNVDENGNAKIITDYTITDTADGFAFDPSTINVTIGGEKLVQGPDIADDTAPTTPYYAIIGPRASETAPLQIVIRNYDKGNYTSPSQIVITYQATLTNKNIADDSTNTFSVETNNGKVPGTPETHTYNYKVVIDKYKAGDESQKLSGAKFVLKDGNEKNAKFYKYTETKTTNPATGESVTTGVVSWVENQSEATEVTTNNNGAAEFKGLKAGTYYLYETQAPEGYNLLKDPTTVTLDEVTGKLDSIQSLTHTAKVANNTGSELPSTGGMGTTIFYVLGAALVIGAGVVLVTRRRLSK